MYESITDLPLVCQINLPEAALKVYRAAYNKAWAQYGEDPERHALAQGQAWSAVREKFEREKETGRWIPRTATLEPRIARLRNRLAAKRSAQ
jgi:cation transport regulator